MTDVLSGGGEMGRLMRALDWAATPIGAVEGWSQSLRTAVRIILTSRFPMLIWWGPELVMLYNDAYRPILGATKHPGAMGQRGRECWPEIWDVIGPMLEGVLATGAATWSDDQLLLLHRNSYLEECYFTFSYSPIQDEAGSVGGVFCAVTETTQRVVGERRLRTLRELAGHSAAAQSTAGACQLALATLAHASADIPFAALYLTERGGRSARLTGATSRAPALPSDVTLDAVAAEAGLEWLLAEALQQGQPVLVDASLSPWPDPPRTGLVLPVVVSEHETPPALLLIAISPHRTLDEDYRGFLEVVVNQIASGLAAARSYEAERQRAEALAERDRAKTMFFANVSHEFRTPLTLMLGPLEAALQEPKGVLPPATRDSLRMAQRNALRLLKLVNTLLDFSRIQAGRSEASYEPTDLAGFTAELAGVFRSTIEHAGLRLSVTCPPLPAAVYIDRDMWEKVVLNLLSNAFKFTFAGEITVALRPAGDVVELTVRDTGTGIASAELPHIFERFHQVKGARGRTFEGSGIGLALVQELVKLHGGSVRVESTPGQGSTFTVAIPCGTAHLPAERIGAVRTLASTDLHSDTYLQEALRWLPDGPPLPPPPAADAPAEPLPVAPEALPARILVADDNADMRDYVRRLLGQEHTVVAVSDGAMALEAARTQRFDLLLADVMMPRLDGFALLRAWRADERTRHIPVILLSARAGEEARIEGVGAGADDYLTKPFSARELLARVRAQIMSTRLRDESVQREQRLRAAAEVVREQLEQILEGIKDDFVMYDDAWRYVYVNEQAARSLGYPKEQLIGQRIWDLFPQAVGNRFYQEMLGAKAAGREVVFEHYYAPWGKWIENRGYPVPNGMLLFAADITERKRVEAALRESEARFRHMADHAPVMVWVTQPDGACTYLSTSWYAFTGQTPEEGLGFGWTLAVHPDDYVATEQTFTQANEQRAAFALEYQLRRWDGVYRWVIDSAVPRFSDDGEFLGYIGSVMDITERKQTELERLELYEAERTARAAAERAARERDELLAYIAHDLKNPLTALLGATQLLQRRLRTPAAVDVERIQRGLGTIEQTAARLAAQLNELQDVASLQAGQPLDLQWHSIDLVALVERVVVLRQAATEQHQIRMETSLTELPCICDPFRIERVMSNLLGNAVKYSPQGGEITVRITDTTDSTSEGAIIEVRDQGIGIAAADLPHIFERFYRGQNVDGQSGTGLGLASAQAIIQQHGGEVSIISELGQGTVVTVRLPLKPAGVPSPADGVVADAEDER